MRKCGRFEVRSFAQKVTKKEKENVAGSRDVKGGKDCGQKERRRCGPFEATCWTGTSVTITARCTVTRSHDWEFRSVRGCKIGTVVGMLNCSLLANVGGRLKLECLPAGGLDAGICCYCRLGLRVAVP